MTTEMKDRRVAYDAIRTGRKAFRGYPAERAEGKQARRTMLQVFAAKGMYLFASVLQRLIKNPRADSQIKRQRFHALLSKYAKATTGGI
jgi:hypothetical protein